MKSYEGGLSFDVENRMNPQLEEVLEAFTAFALGPHTSEQWGIRLTKVNSVFMADKLEKEVQQRKN